LIPAFFDEVRMGPKTPVTEGDFFQQPLREQINLKHPLVGLADLIDWDRLRTSMSESFVSSRGRPATSPRLIAGLLYLQHAFDLSDEEVVWLRLYCVLVLLALLKRSAANRIIQARPCRLPLILELSCHSAVGAAGKAP
jgi:hypothetical protein